MSRVKKLKILMIAPTPYFSDRGCHVRIYEEAKALMNRGHEVVICTYHFGRDLGDMPIVRIPNIPWYKKRSAGPSWHKLYLDILLFIKTWKTSRRLAPDVIHAHLHEGALIGFFLKKLFGVPLVFDCQGSLTGELLDHGFVRKSGWLYRLFRAVEGLIARGADHIITSSFLAAQMLVTDFDIPACRVTAVGDGVDVEVFSPISPSASLRHQLGLPTDIPLVVYLGVMTEYQGMDLLLEAIKLLHEQGGGLHFLLMGYPEESYRHRAEVLGIASMTTFTGKIDYANARAYLCLGTLAVSPKRSKTEANGKLYNYMACGLPAVVFDTPVNREVLGNAGVYAVCDDVLDFAFKIKRLAEDKDYSMQLSRLAREKAVEEYAWDRVVGSIEESYRMALEHLRSGRNRVTFGGEGKGRGLNG